MADSQKIPNSLQKDRAAQAEKETKPVAITSSNYNDLRESREGKRCKAGDVEDDGAKLEILMKG